MPVYTCLTLTDLEWLRILRFACQYILFGITEFILFIKIPEFFVCSLDIGKSRLPPYSNVRLLRTAHSGSALVAVLGRSALSRATRVAS